MLKIINQLRKTKILELTLLCVISGTMIVSFSGSEGFRNSNNKNEILKATSTTPVSGKVVILDAGHGGEDRWSSS